MNEKEKAIIAIRSLPDNASLKDVIERLYFLTKIEKGIEQADSEKTMTHAEVRKRVAKWLK